MCKRHVNGAGSLALVLPGILEVHCCLEEKVQASTLNVEFDQDCIHPFMLDDQNAELWDVSSASKSLYDKR